MNEYREFKPNLLTKWQRFKLQEAINKVSSNKYSCPILNELKTLINKIRVNTF